jgi:hypothetical protein
MSGHWANNTNNAANYSGVARAVRKHSLICHVVLGVTPDGSRCFGNGVGFGVLVTGDGVCVDSGVAVARDRVGTLGGAIL